MSQSGTIETCPSYPLVRSRIIPFITTLHHKLPIFDRCCFCHAISILDLFERKSQHTLIEICEKDAKNEELIAIALMLLSFKYMKGRTIKISLILKEMGEVEEIVSLKERIIILEEEILAGIDFEFPLENAYQLLDSLVSHDQFQDLDARKFVVITLKILLTSFKHSPALSFNPELATEIHNITLNNPHKASKQALGIYRDSFSILVNSKTSKSPVPTND